MVDWTRAQASVIGSALINADCVPEILAEMRPEDFSAEYRRYYEAIAQLSGEGVPVDPVTVLNLIGPAYREMTEQLVRQTPTAANVSAYIGVCKDQSRLALLRAAGTALSGAATLEEAREALNDAAAVSLESSRQTSWTAGECVSEWFEALNRQEKPEYLSVGIACLDNTLRTVAGNYVVVAGHTSHGKSAMALQMAWHLSKTKRVGYFAFEGARADWTSRLISAVSRVPMPRVQDMDLTEGEARRCAAACAEISRHSLRIEMAAGKTVDEIRAATLRRGYEVIFVDYLQKVAPPGASKRFGRVQEVSEISSGLQVTGLRYGVTVYAMSQLSRQEKSGDEYVPLPGLSDLRESGQIEQDADAVLFVHAPWKRSFPEFRILDAAKVRNGKPSTFFADFHGDIQTFAEPTQEHADKYKRLMDAKRGKPALSGFGAGAGGFSKLEKPKKDNPFLQEAMTL